jgi:hypothetical protein
MARMNFPGIAGSSARIEHTQESGFEERAIRSEVKTVFQGS